MKWHKFDKAVTRGRWLPPQKKYVLVQCTPKSWGQAPPVAVGYLKFAAGDKQSPFFVVPGVDHAEVIAWCDCLPDPLDAPLWSDYGQTILRNLWDECAKLQGTLPPG